MFRLLSQEQWWTFCEVILGQECPHFHLSCPNRKVKTLIWRTLMKVTERDEINRLRSLGYGHIKIAQQLGLSENSVKSFCRRHPLQTAEPRRQAKGTCPQCGAKVDSRRRFCSDACRTAWWNAHREHPNGKGQAGFICQYCTKSFAGYPAQNPKYCCHACYIAARYGKGRGNRG